jgi:hypothetical protein
MGSDPVRIVSDVGRLTESVEDKQARFAALARTFGADPTDKIGRENGREM